jgi:hypothetical protein
LNKEGRKKKGEASNHLSPFSLSLVSPFTLSLFVLFCLFVCLLCLFVSFLPVALLSFLAGAAVGFLFRRRAAGLRLQGGNKMVKDGLK